MLCGTRGRKIYNRCTAYIRYDVGHIHDRSGSAAGGEGRGVDDPLVGEKVFVAATAAVSAATMPWLVLGAWWRHARTRCCCLFELRNTADSRGPQAHIIGTARPQHGVENIDVLKLIHDRPITIGSLGRRFRALPQLPPKVAASTDLSVRS